MKIYFMFQEIIIYPNFLWTPLLQMLQLVLLLLVLFLPLQFLLYRSFRMPSPLLCSLGLGVGGVAGTGRPACRRCLRHVPSTWHHIHCRFRWGWGWWGSWRTFGKQSALKDFENFLNKILKLDDQKKLNWAPILGMSMDFLRQKIFLD